LPSRQETQLLKMAVIAEGKKSESSSISAINQTLEFASNSIIKPSISVVQNVSSHYMMVRRTIRLNIYKK